VKIVEKKLTNHQSEEKMKKHGNTRELCGGLIHCGPLMDLRNYPIIYFLLLGPSVLYTFTM
jgi:hypothetical protein